MPFKDKSRYRKYQEDYRNRPENKLKHLERSRLPENKIKVKKIRDRPENKIKAKKIRDIPENKIRKKEYDNDPKNIARKKERQDRPENKLKTTKYQEDYRNRPNVIKRVKQYKENNSKLFRKQSRIRRVRKLNAKGSHTIDEWLKLKLLLGNHCLDCWKTNVKLEQDHIIPLTKGGTDWLDNIQSLCSKCNGTKHAKYPVPNLIELCKNSKTVNSA